MKQILFTNPTTSITELYSYAVGHRWLSMGGNQFSKALDFLTPDMRHIRFFVGGDDIIVGYELPMENK